MTTFTSLCHILTENYQVEADLLQPDTKLADLSIDSLGMIELVFAIEDTFEIRVPDTDAQLAGDIGTLGELATHIDSLCASDAARVADKAAVHRPGGDPTTSP